MSVPSKPSNVILIYETDASGSPTMTIQITEASGAPAVTKYQFGGNYFTYAGDNGGWRDFPSTSTPGTYTFSSTLLSSDFTNGAWISGIIFFQSVNSAGTTPWLGSSTTPGKFRYPSSAPTSAVATPANASCVLTYSGNTDTYRTSFAYKLGSGNWVNTTSATTQTITGLTNGSTQTVTLATAYTDATNSSFFKAYRFTPDCVDTILITPKNNAPVISNLIKTSTTVTLTVTTSISTGVQSPLEYIVLLNGVEFCRISA